MVPNVYRVFTRRSSVVLDRVILWDIYKSTFHLVYYASLLIYLLVCSVCPQYFKKLPIKAIILQICSDFFTVHKLCLIIANYSSFTVSL